MPLHFQLLLTVSLLILVGLWRRAQSARNNRSWEAIVAALQSNDWGLEEVSERYLYRGGIVATPTDVWCKIQGTRGLWAMYSNAPLLIQLADYAADYCKEPDEALLAGFRRDAFQIRLAALSGILRHTMRSDAKASMAAHRAALLYSELLAQLTHLIQESAGQLLPSYLGAM